MKGILFLMTVLVFSSYLYAQTADETITYKSNNERAALIVTFNQDHTCDAVLKMGLPKKNDKTDVQSVYRYGCYDPYGSALRPYKGTEYPCAYPHEKPVEKKYNVTFKDCDKENFVMLICETVSSMPKKERQIVATGIGSGSSAYDAVVERVKIDMAKCDASNFVDKIVNNI